MKHGSFDATPAGVVADRFEPFLENVVPLMRGLVGVEDVGLCRLFATQGRNYRVQLIPRAMRAYEMAQDNDGEHAPILSVIESIRPDSFDGSDKYPTTRRQSSTSRPR